MQDPEIDRRCIHCGASVRSRALFCPQCGEPVSTQSIPDSATNVADKMPTGSNQSEAHFDPAETRPLMSISDLSETRPLNPAPVAVPESEPEQKHAGLHKATAVARGLEENVMGRVDKIRKVSSVVIDQAAYDPSLRFILVAAALFFLFLVLLIMSKVLG